MALSCLVGPPAPAIENAKQGGTGRGHLDSLGEIGSNIGTGLCLSTRAAKHRSDAARDRRGVGSFDQECSPGLERRK